MKTLTPMKEYQHYDGEAFITFNIVNLEENNVTLAVTNRGKISIVDYEIYSDINGNYFEYGCYLTKIYIDDFEDMEN